MKHRGLFIMETIGNQATIYELKRTNSIHFAWREKEVMKVSYVKIFGK